MANFNTGLTKQQIITAFTKALESMSEQEVQSAISTAISGKQDILSFDNTPTSGSSNPVTSGGIYTDQQRQEVEIAAVLDRDAKNIFDTNLIPQTATRNGVTITRTEKGLHISGTASSTADTQIASFVLDIPGDDYHVYINTAASALNVWCAYRKSGASSDTYAPAVRDTLNTGDSLKYLYFKSLPGGATFDVDVDIMVCTAADYDISSQFVPYAPTNRELYEMILALQSGRSVQSAASLMQAGRIDAELMDDTDNDVSETSGGEEMR